MKLKGIGATEGLAVGTCVVIETYVHGDYSQERIEKAAIAVELEKIKSGLNIANAQLQAIGQGAKAKGKKAEADLMMAHEMMLNDPELEAMINQRIEQEHYTARGAVQTAVEAMACTLETLEDAYLKERAQDVRDVGNRLLQGVMGLPHLDLSQLLPGTLLVAHDMTPSMLAACDDTHLLGFVSEVGGLTSHTAILASNMGIPAVLGCKGIVEIAKATQGYMAIDGRTGEVNLGLSESDRQALALRIEAQKSEAAQLDRYKSCTTALKDGSYVELAANIMSPLEAQMAVKEGAEGVGLFRTEFLFMDRTEAPSEQEQFNAYKDATLALAGKSVIIRTLDIGGDKTVDYLGMQKEENPFLGLRALRLCFERKTLFMTQLRAILRASAFGKVKIMFPMIASLEELLSAKELLEKAKTQLRHESLSFDEQLEVGIMIEIPSAAIIADQLIAHCDFFSIGSNDLTQYTLAVDRMNESISHLYNPYHPAMLRLIHQVANAANATQSHKFAGMCGEMAGDPKAAVLLVGLGLKELSMSPKKIAKVRAKLHTVSLEDARALAKKALGLSSAKAIEALLTHE